jgi:arylsulfatase A-like enzyme
MTRYRNGAERVIRSPGLLAGVLGLLGACTGPPPQADEAVGDARPNIVVIMADDMGYSDLGAYGGEVSTPSLDALAENGLRFTQFYNTARCVPTRASLLTGLYAHRAGLGGMTFDQGEAGYQGHLSDGAVTIAEVLGRAGYRTGMVGKWHVSETRARDEAEQLEWLAHRADYGDFSPLDQYPTARGFDDFYGNIWGVVDYFDPFSLVNGTEPVRDVPDGYYHTDAISDTAVAYVERYARGDAPFLLYVAHTAPHWPLHALPEDIAVYEDTYAVGWQAVREARHRRQVELGVFEPGEAVLTPRIEPELRWEENPDTVWDTRAMAVHAAMIHRLDRGVGRLVRALEETGELDNTLILFLSDNGASPERPSEFGPGFDRAGSTREGQEVVYPVDRSPAALPGPQTVHSGIGPRWANVANTPFRYWKARVHEGGINTPLIVHWPAGLGVPPGSFTEQPGHVIDLMATALDVAGVPYPDRYDGRPIHPPDGLSLLPVLRGGERDGHGALFWEHFGARAVRQGSWKLVSLEEGAPWELYDLDRDRTEMEDRAARHPDRVAAMAALWDEWARETEVLPRPRGP